MNLLPKKNETDPVIAALREAPEVIGFMAKREQRILADRKKAAARLAEIDRVVPPKWDALTADIESARVAYKEPTPNIWPLAPG